MYPALSIVPKDLDNGHLKVDDILRVGHRWTNVRAIRGLQGMDSDKLLRVLAPHLPHLEELHIKGEVVPGVMEVVEKLSSLKRLHVQFDYDSEYPDLPLQLEELSIRNVNDDQLEHVMSMPNLRSLYVRSYEGPSLTFPPSKYGKLLWLRVAFDSTNKSTMMSLVRAFASSLQTLQLYCPVNDKTKYNPDYYHSDLGEILASCDLQALRRLVLERPFKDIPCSEMAACLLQQRTIRSYFPSSVEVVCGSCHTHPVLS
ncbi:uncharacterized protein LOC127749371 [Frankliniella occidentalis]|nr:uncharacterized protein LOC127749371 [Frankliniella occidentalis]